jgi:hypothetical protein
MGFENLKITVNYDEKTEEVKITANAEGLRYLADVCTNLIGKEGPAAHWHFMEEMNTLRRGSNKMVITFVTA